MSGHCFCGWGEQGPARFVHEQMKEKVALLLWMDQRAAGFVHEQMKEKFAVFCGWGEQILTGPSRLPFSVPLVFIRHR